MEDTKKEVLKIGTYFCLALSLVSTISYMIYTILNSSNLVNQVISVISVFILAVFSVLYVIMGMYARSTKIKMFIIIGSLLLSFYSIIQIIVGINQPRDFVLDFVGMDIKEVVNWANEREIVVEQEFKNSDTVSKYKVISQDIKEGTPTRDIDKIKVIVSDGVDTSVSTEVTNMVGWDLDDVIEFIDLNHLTNVTILFEFNDKVEKDKIISQDVIREIKRNEPVTLTSSLGKKDELKSVTMDNLVGMDTFHALVYLGRNNLKYSIEYVYNEDKEEGIVLKQSIKKWEIISPKDDVEIVLSVVKKDKITVPDLSKMNISSVTNWATNNRLKVEVMEEYHDTIKKDYIISYKPFKGSLIDIDSTISVVVSKGQLKMIKFTNVDEFISWADENDVLYKIDYEFSNSVENGKLISISHKENQIIKNNDTVKLVISQGGNTIIPNLVGMTKDEANVACQKANIKCIFSDNDSSNYDKVVKQSMRSGSNVPVNTTVTLTLGE